jgi:hypothetical protein
MTKADTVQDHDDGAQHDGAHDDGAQPISLVHHGGVANVSRRKRTLNMFLEAKPTSIAVARGCLRTAWANRHENGFDPGFMTIPTNRDRTNTMSATEFCVSIGASQYQKRQRKSARKKQNTNEK